MTRDAEETYTDDCPLWGAPITSVDAWNDGTLRCSKCGRKTVVVESADLAGQRERRHAIELEEPPMA